ncbi:MAG: hypothetical protein JWR12_2511 [Mucilaginibacter sp.]|nr:hypothetical protein [Mucilaginibacter sp.]
MKTFTFEKPVTTLNKRDVTLGHSKGACKDLLLPCFERLPMTPKKIMLHSEA